MSKPITRVAGMRPARWPSGRATRRTGPCCGTFKASRPAIRTQRGASPHGPWPATATAPAPTWRNSRSMMRRFERRRYLRSTPWPTFWSTRARSSRPPWSARAPVSGRTRMSCATWLSAPTAISESTASSSLVPRLATRWRSRTATWSGRGSTWRMACS